MSRPSAACRKTPRSNLKQDMLKLNAKKAIENTFTTIANVFVFGGPVKEVVLSIGSTVRSAKEVHILRFPVGYYDGQSVAKGQCISKLFRTIVSSKFISEDHSIKPGSKVTVLVLAPRQCKVCCEHLSPRLSYRLPRCTRYIVKLTCHAPVASAELSHMDDWHLDVSGIEPLDNSISENAKKADIRKSQSLTFDAETNYKYADEQDRELSKQQRVYGDVILSQSSTSDSDEDFVWYQVPTCIEGYRDKKATDIS